MISYQDHHMCYPDRAEAGHDLVPGSPHVAAHSSQAASGVKQGDGVKHYAGDVQAIVDFGDYPDLWAV